MKQILERVSDEAIAKEHHRRYKLDRDCMSGESPTFNNGGRWVRNELLPEIQKLIKQNEFFKKAGINLSQDNKALRAENEKLKIAIKRMQPRRLVDGD